MPAPMPLVPPVTSTARPAKSGTVMDHMLGSQANAR
jgi:hypothetical protein